jgi:predicted acetyltransferase
MRAEHPKPSRIPQLRQLWQEAFGDDDAFLDKFFTTAYSPNRCRVVTLEGQAAAALYWLDCQWEGKKLAYLYAVATAKAFQGRGLCRFLLEDTHRVLTQSGYAGAVLCPGNEGLFTMYAKLGYENMSAIREFSAESAVKKYNEHAD